MRAAVTLTASIIVLVVATASVAPRSSAVGGCNDVSAPRFRVPPRYLAAWSTGLWMPSGGRCLLRVVAGSRSVRPLLRLRRGERIVGLQWAPDGRSFVVATRRPRRVRLLDPAGRVVGRWRLDTAAFVADGRLVLGSDSGVYLRLGRGVRLIAPRAPLVRAAGFPSATGVRGPDIWGYSRGYGKTAVALQWWSGQRYALLVVDTRGSVTRASPSGRGFSSVGGSAWTTDGRRLLQFTVFRSPAGSRKDHDHCLHVWSERRGVRRAFCVSGLARRFQFHFDKLLWARDGRTGLLNDGTVVSSRGRVVGIARGAGDPAFAVLWRPG